MKTMTNGELIMQKAKQILTYCNTFTNEEIQLSILGEIDLKEISLKRAIEVMDNQMFGIKYTSTNRFYFDFLCELNKIFMWIYGNEIQFHIDLNPDHFLEIENDYIIDYSDIITVSNAHKHTFFNKDGFFIVCNYGYKNAKAHFFK